MLLLLFYPISDRPSKQRIRYLIKMLYFVNSVAFHEIHPYYCRVYKVAFQQHCFVDIPSLNDFRVYQQRVISSLWSSHKVFLGDKHSWESFSCKRDTLIIQVNNESVAAAEHCLLIVRKAG